MSDPINIVSTPRPTAKPIPFKITTEVPDQEPVVEEFTFTPPGSEGMLLPYLDGTDDYLPAGWQWILAGLPDEQATRLREKYKDPKDPFGTTQLGALIRALDGAAAERPTTSPDA